MAAYLEKKTMATDKVSYLVDSELLNGRLAMIAFSKSNNLLSFGGTVAITVLIYFASSLFSSGYAFAECHHRTWLPLPLSTIVTL